MNAYVYSTVEARKLAATLGVDLTELACHKAKKYFIFKAREWESPTRGHVVEIDIDVNPDTVEFLVKTEPLVNEYGSGFGRTHIICPVPKDWNLGGVPSSELPEGNSDDIWDQTRISVVDYHTYLGIDPDPNIDVEKVRRRVRDALNKTSCVADIMAAARLLRVKIK